MFLDLNTSRELPFHRRAAEDPFWVVLAMLGEVGVYQCSLSVRHGP